MVQAIKAIKSTLKTDVYVNRIINNGITANAHKIIVHQKIKIFEIFQ